MYYPVIFSKKSTISFTYLTLLLRTLGQCNNKMSTSGYQMYISARCYHGLYKMCYHKIYGLNA